MLSPIIKHFYFISQFVVFAIFKLENLTKASIIHLHALSTWEVIQSIFKNIKNNKALKFCQGFAICKDMS
jgi:hypothetical protein